MTLLLLFYNSSQNKEIICIFLYVTSEYYQFLLIENLNLQSLFSFLFATVSILSKRNNTCDLKIFQITEQKILSLSFSLGFSMGTGKGTFHTTQDSTYPCNLPPHSSMEKLDIIRQHYINNDTQQGIILIKAKSKNNKISNT